MSARSFRAVLWPTVFAIPGILILLGLGTWQVDRLFWKTELIASRNAAAHAPPVPLPNSIEEARGLEFHPVRTTGEFRHDRELDVGATSEAGAVGYQIMTPLRLPDGRYLLVNRGFVPSELRDPAKREAGQTPGEVTVEGLLRLPPAGRPGWFVPDNSAARNYWFYVDLPAMAAAAGVAPVLPFYVDAGPAPNPGGWPRGGTTRLALPNDHLQYAITWYALAVALAVIYFLFVRKRIADS